MRREHLVDRAAGRLQLLGHDVHLYVLQRHRDEHLALSWWQLLAHRAAQGAQELGRLDVRLCSGCADGQPIPRVVVVGGRDTASTPGVSSSFVETSKITNAYAQVVNRLAPR